MRPAADGRAGPYAAGRRRDNHELSRPSFGLINENILEEDLSVSRMRFKGSERNKQIAVLFSNTVSVSGEASEANIPCVGPQSLFSIFSRIFPLLARDPKSSATVHADAVSMIEMNKSLLVAGYCIFRKRERIPGACKRGTRRWKFRGWVNPHSQDEMGHLLHKLHELHNLFPETRCVTAEDLIYHLSEMTQTEELRLHDSLSDMSESERDFNALFHADPQADHCSGAQLQAPLAPSPAFCSLEWGGCGTDSAMSHGLLDSLNSTVLRCFSLAKQLRQHAAGQPIASSPHSPHSQREEVS